MHSKGDVFVESFNENDIEPLKNFINKYGSHRQEELPFYLMGKKEVAHMVIDSEHHKCFVLIPNIGYFCLNITNKNDKEIYQGVAHNIEELISE